MIGPGRLRPMNTAELEAVRLHDEGRDITDICVATHLARAEVAAAVELRDRFGQLLTPPTQESRPGPIQRARRRPTDTSSTTKKGTRMTAVLDTPDTATPVPNYCPNQEKRRFDSELEALAAVAEDDAKYGTDNHPYQCVCEAWHNTTQAGPRRVLKTSSERIDRLAADFPIAPLRPGANLSTGFFVLTPKVAAFWLSQFNIHNRNLRGRGTGSLSVDLVTGGWDLNGDTIRFDTDGVMFDGQHRVHAIATSGVPVPIILVTGLDPIAQDTTDTGMRRTFADTLKLAGETDVNNLAAAVAQVCRWKAGQVRGNTKTNLSVKVLQRVLRDHPEVRDAIVVSRRVRTQISVQNSVTSLASWLFHAIDAADHDFFFDKLISGADLSRTDPIFHLREKLLADVTAKRRLRKIEVLAFFIKAWNCYRDGEPMRNLAWRSGGERPEAFPTPH